MLDADTKRRIDTARDILVGKVPDPKSQVEQITIALIYKFMDDIDAYSEELGGNRRYFAGDFEKYGWAKLMGPGIGGHEMLNLYAEAITRMPENSGIPSLFRDIFNNAYLPYRDPETLRAFLKTIDEFEYDHSERLGDAFEYLLSVMAAQGDAGQFRTPRHIIDFIVAVVDPKKDETVLDPACGTAGFLISAYKHIQATNTDADGNSTLTPDDRARLANNFKGYDISPDMVRLSLVNMYLHGFAAPHIFEYDTLTSDDRWNEHADVILANPPFMSPKGGIRPHNRFSIQSKRSEVLFVDYMAEHLAPAGRAGVIVPEGIIFQSQTAHKRLRKMLVEDYLVAVVSLPGGVFNPYSGVKTSILILDRALARRTDSIAFFKVENDGFDLGAQRRPIDENDLPHVQAELGEYLGRLRAGESAGDLQPALGLVVPREEIASVGEYNLSGERFRVPKAGSSLLPMVRLGEVAELIRGITFRKSDQLEAAQEGSLPVATTRAAQESGLVADALYHVPRSLLKDDRKLLKSGDILISTANSLRLLGRTTHVRGVSAPMSFGAFMTVIRASSAILDSYLLQCLRTESAYDFFVKNANTTTNISNLNVSTLADFHIPLPPLEVQREIVAEIEGYQKVIDGARAVVENYRPHIAVDPEWPIVPLKDICEINPETVSPALAFPDQTISYVDISSVENETGRFLAYSEVASSDAPGRARRGIKNGDVLLSTVRPNLKAFTLLNQVRDRAVASTGFAVLRARADVARPAFILASVRSERAVGQMVNMMGKGAYPSINQSDVSAISIPLPPLHVQEHIVAEIRADQAVVDANRKLIARFEGKIQAAVARVWSG